jgi:hypothetical protein
MSNEDVPVNGNRCAFPASGNSASGLTKRELLAAMAMQGWLAGCENAFSEFTGEARCADVAAKCSVKFADALLAALEQDHGK